MDYSNIPYRAIRKFQADGMRSMIAEGRTILADDLFSYIFSKLLSEGRIEFMSRDYILNLDNTYVFEKFDKEIRHKYQSGGRWKSDPETYTPGNRFVWECDDAIVLGPAGIGVDGNGRVIGDTIGSPSQLPGRINTALARSAVSNGLISTANISCNLPSAETRIGCAATMTLPYINYYHWTVESLIRIRLLEKYAKRTGTYPALLIPADRPSWVDETLELIGYKGKTRELGSSVVGVKKLIVPTFPDPIPSECSWIRNRMTGGDKGGDKRIYISREDATARRVSNRGELLGLLNQYGVQEYTLSEITVKRQIELFSRADLVIGAHGAGLTNILYSYDVDVVELFGDRKGATYDRIADHLNHGYYPIQCEPVKADIRVNANRLQNIIKDIL